MVSSAVKLVHVARKDPITFVTDGGPRTDIRIHRGWLLPVDGMPEKAIKMAGGTQYRNFSHAVCRIKPEVVMLQRRYALGDIAMLLPILKAMERRFSFTMVIATEPRFFGYLTGAGRQVWDYRQSHLCPAQVKYSLDLCLEQDHHGGEASDCHRCDLYARALGFRLKLKYGQNHGTPGHQ